MLMNKKVSILMSIYNEIQSEILRAINSLLNQDYDNFEIIIVVDDPNRTDIEELLTNINSSKIIHIKNEKNVGLAMSMNKAFERSEGYYIARMDADDYSYKSRISKEVAYIESNNVDLVCTEFKNVDYMYNELSDIKTEFFSDEEINRKILIQNCIHHPTVLMKRSAFIEVNGYRNFDCAQDFDLWLRLKEMGMKFGIINEVLLDYTIRKDSVSNKKNMKQFATLIYIQKLFNERLKNGIDSYSFYNYQEYVKQINMKKDDFDKMKLILKKSADCNNSKINRIMLKMYLTFRYKMIRKSYFEKIYTLILIKRKKKQFD